MLDGLTWAYAFCLLNAFLVNSAERFAMTRYGDARSGAAEQDKGTLDLIRQCVGLATVVALIAPLAAPGLDLPPPQWVTLTVGLGICWAGTTLRFWSIKRLGAFFVYVVNVQEQQTLITDGPFRLLRHPSYAGGLLSCLGLGIAFDNWIGLAALVVLPSYALLRRIQAEEVAMEAAFGKEFQEWRDRSWRLIPLVW